ncbi:bifunctional phosphoribosylaminoimidazolecarboxamide formyltransferase/IMP cyclohydrolase [Thermodesulfovibrionales bacterium]|nr:bifunctional phosphoribosylaminoimidazolecarboxamide formyltransferase/IMP cyclohydrolase [Thermodesulfovibrionales bacterium]MCL0087042.1 bifunctional phosphoribosylaminoimidazolecarboxamide formyltransferase/IMP cyclohydrolase [Thermodesulfovibrionales bacterium]
MIKRAIISVSDKRGLIEFARELSEMDVEILSTGGTARVLQDAGVSVVKVSDYTGFPEMLSGRLKTLHPKIHGGLLSRRNNPEDMNDIEKHDIRPIDMVAVNLYPFEETASRVNATLEEAVEDIDIGGPTMLRAASKNFQDVTVVVDPDDYPRIIEEMKSSDRGVSLETKLNLAKKGFAHTARYDTLIADYLTGITEKEASFPEYLTTSLKRVASLRYGENPHQKAAIYKERTKGLSLVNAKILQGKELSFNNYLDTNSALLLALEFDKKACVIVKHNNPCGVAVGDTVADAYKKAVKTDPVSAFGGVVAFNTKVDDNAAHRMKDLFLEVVIAPSFTKEAIEIFSNKPDVRLLELPDILLTEKRKIASWDIKKIAGGLLLQEWDYSMEDIMSLKAITKRQPTKDELEALALAWKTCKHVKSNAIVYAFKDKTVGIGIGQTSRVYSAKIGAINACELIKGSVVASDGFFPFRDGIDILHEVGVTAVVQPGGSIRDAEVIQAADEYNMAMVITGVRHFRH